MDKSDMDGRWTEAILEQCLRPTTAPESLWRCVETPRIERTAVAVRRLAWALTAAMLTAAVFWGLHLRGETAAALDIRPVETARVRSSAPARTCALCHASFNPQSAFD